MSPIRSEKGAIVGASKVARDISERKHAEAELRLIHALTNEVGAAADMRSALAAVVYVAHLGQAKSDAGPGYELMAITAVVLGGASIFGGRGTILGTVLGLLSIVLLQNGLLRSRRWRPVVAAGPVVRLVAGA